MIFVLGKYKKVISGRRKSLNESVEKCFCVEKTVDSMVSKLEGEMGEEPEDDRQE